MPKRTRWEFNRVGRASARALAAGLVAAMLIVSACGKEEKKPSKPKGYFEGLAGAKEMSEEKACQAQMAGLGKSLAAYATINDGQFPPTLKKLVEAGLASRELFECPGRPTQAYVYLPGQNQGMPAANLLVLEEQATHRGRCNVLRLNGSVEALTPEEVSAARAKTQAAIRSAGGS